MAGTGIGGAALCCSLRSSGRCLPTPSPCRGDSPFDWAQRIHLTELAEGPRPGLALHASAISDDPETVVKLGPCGKIGPELDNPSLGQVKFSLAATGDSVRRYGNGKEAEEPGCQPRNASFPGRRRSCALIEDPGNKRRGRHRHRPENVAARTATCARSSVCCLLVVLDPKAAR